jgi:hypothetical protein
MTPLDRIFANPAPAVSLPGQFGKENRGLGRAEG